MKLKDKREGIKLLEKLLGKRAEYAGSPTFAYTIGEFTVDRNGNLLCEDAERLKEIEGRMADEGAGAEDCRKAVIRAGVDDATAIRNLINMIHSKQYLIKKAAGYQAFEVTADLVDAVNEKEMSPKDMLVLIRYYKPKGIEVLDGKVSITGLPDTDTYKTLADAMINAASRSRWICPDETVEENEKYYMRAWLVRIGLGGADTKVARAILLKNLKGHTAFRTQEDREKWRERH